MHVNRYQPGSQMGVLALELDAMVGAEVQGALPAGHDHAVRSSHLLDALEHGDLMVQAHVLGEQGAGPVLVEDARIVERGDVVVDKCHQPLTFDQFSKLSLIYLLAHCGPSRTIVDYSPDESGTMTPLTYYTERTPRLPEVRGDF